VPAEQLINQLMSEHQQKPKLVILLKLHQLRVMLPKLRLFIGCLLGLLLFQSLQWLLIAVIQELLQYLEHLIGKQSGQLVLQFGKFATTIASSSEQASQQYITLGRCIVD